VKATLLPDAKITLQRLLEKQWIERQGIGVDVSYRITEKGLAAKTAPILSSDVRFGIAPHANDRCFGKMTLPRARMFISSVDIRVVVAGRSLRSILHNRH
jgi:hypothetical protein